MKSILHADDVQNVSDVSDTVINREKIRPLLSLYRDWGYRTNNGQHEAFEEASHCVRIMQYYTDGVMRNLQQIDQGFTWIDTNPYRPVTIDSEEFQRVSQHLITCFFHENPGHLRAAVQFAQHKLTSMDNMGFACMVCCMRSMLCVYKGYFVVAEDIADVWYRHLIALREKEVEEMDAT